DGSNFHGKLCPNCMKVINKMRYQKNKEQAIKNTREYYQNNKEEIKRQKKVYYEINKGLILSNHKEYERKRLKEDPVFKLRKSASLLVRKSLKKQNLDKSGKSLSKYLSYSILELKMHLEQQFEPWMTWENHGKYDIKTWNDNDPTTWTWQLDHIVPQANLPYTSMTDDNFKKCWALSNLRPLSAKQNNLDGVTRIRHV
ncbi:MAG TPA: hypothetical protein VNW06_07510, partial [Cytophagaceae bacterium]|nr:hypothetical protein [Cytophagaceae bacterium]